MIISLFGLPRLSRFDVEDQVVEIEAGESVTVRESACEFFVAGSGAKVLDILRCLRDVVVLHLRGAMDPVEADLWSRRQRWVLQPGPGGAACYATRGQ